MKKLTKLQKAALKTLELLAKKQDAYQKINKKIVVEQGGDFPTIIQAFDDDALNEALNVLDLILDGEASYWFFECRGMKDGGSITFQGPIPKEYKIKTIKDLEEYLCR